MLGIKCEYDLCIYNRGGYICMLDEIRINCIGMCDKNITLQFPPEKLEELKQAQMQILVGYEKSV